MIENRGREYIDWLKNVWNIGNENKEVVEEIERKEEIIKKNKRYMNDNIV